MRHASLLHRYSLIVSLTIIICSSAILALLLPHKQLDGGAMQPLAAQAQPPLLSVVAQKPIVYLIPHQDDELFMAGHIIRSVATHHPVYLVVVSDGNASRVRDDLNGKNIAGVTTHCNYHGYGHDPEHEGYFPLTKEDLTRARNKEFIASAAALGVTETHIWFLNETEPIYHDGTIKAVADQALSRIVERYGDGVYVSTAEGHPDHDALAHALKNRTDITNKIFFPLNNTHASRYILLTDQERQKKKNAIAAYSIWNPAEGRFAIGAHSVPDFMSAWGAVDKEWFYTDDLPLRE